MTESRRSILLAAAVAALLLLLLSAHAPALAQEAAAAPAKEETVDAVQTRAGLLTLVRRGPGMEMGLRLDGRKVLDVDGALYGGFKAHFRGMDAGEVVVMWTSDGGSGCPAQFRVVRIVDEARVSLTDEFGDCSDSPAITLRQLPEEELTFGFPGYYQLWQSREPGFRRPAPSAWVYKKGVLREQRPAATRKK